MPIAPESNHPEVPDAAGGHSDASGEAGEQPVTTLRGASVDVDIRRTGRVVAVVCMAALAIIGVILLVAGIHTNSQINKLHQQGVPVAVTVTDCTGLIGGTGGQVAGYACSGSYTVRGTLYHQAIPGTATFRRIGSTFQGVVVPSDPKLLSTPNQVLSQHATWRVAIIPAILLIAAAVIGIGLVRGRRRRHAADTHETGSIEPR